MQRAKAKAIVAASAAEKPVRQRILGAAFGAFTQNGYAATSTLEIATRAKVSKRELYALFGSKQAILVACITERTARMRLRPDLPTPASREKLASALSSFGATLMREVCHPTVMATFRLAVAEAERSPEVAQALDAAGRGAARAALAELVAAAQSAGLVEGGDAVAMARQYLALLWEDLVLRLLLRVAEAPSDAEIRRQAERASAAFLTLHPPSAARRSSRQPRR